MWAVKTKCWRRRMFLFPLSPPCEHPVDLLLGLLLLPPLLYYPNSGAQWEYPVVRCELVGNNKQWAAYRSTGGPIRIPDTSPFYYNPSSSSTTPVFVFTLLLTYNVSTTRPKQRPFFFEPAVVLQELLIISQLWYDLWRSFLYLYVFVL